MKLIVSDRRLLADDVVALGLRDPTGAALPPCTAGSHVKVSIGGEGGPLERAYSLVNAEGASDRYEIAVLRVRDGGGGSAAMHALAPGDLIDVSAPVDGFPLAPAGTEHLLIAGGIGITPLLAMARALTLRGEAFSLHYAARSETAMAYRDEVSQLPDSRLYVDGGVASRGLPLAELLRDPRPGRHVYVCGPAPLIAAVLDQAERQGWAPDHVHHESFQGAVHRGADRPVRLKLAASGGCVVAGAGETLLDALLRSGIEPLHDCRRGECGMCIASVLAGEPEHRDRALSASEKASGRVICLCVSRARTDELTLDL